MYTGLNEKEEENEQFGTFRCISVHPVLSFQLIWHCGESALKTPS